MTGAAQPVPGEYDAAVEVLDELTVVAIRGEIDLSVEDCFRETLLQAIDASRAVVLDLCSCGFMDSRGLHAVIEALRHASSAHVAFTVACTPGEACARLFEMSLGDMVAVHPDRDAAVAAAVGT